MNVEANYQHCSLLVPIEIMTNSPIQLELVDAVE